MNHPAIEMAMKTGYPEIDYLDHERFRNANYRTEEHPIEDMFGSEILTGDKYFIDASGKVVLFENYRDYLQEEAGAVFYEAK
ncbi:hypothetical protein QT711_11480 [Sporosarcina saromensis]|uniref:Uncharacterized protein n=1 Tax=Sporosarcina saromensis TaxID=359365 RepID=A0ABU4G9Z8_9BACL|nr:hypothetical protein [Sporosarcina saromensis]MDW0113809.1 hypothetical protein [Sporosarcina saromensis]